MKEMERLIWRCRRGMLELDIVLNRFMGEHYAALNEQQRAAFNALLDAPDTELWDMIAGRQETADPAKRELLELLGKA
jgi:antitoxin CptB